MWHGADDFTVKKILKDLELPLLWCEVAGILGSMLGTPSCSQQLALEHAAASPSQDGALTNL